MIIPCRSVLLNAGGRGGVALAVRAVQTGRERPAKTDAVTER